MPRPVWKGAVSFGLVHIPVSLYPASEEGGVDFDWLDKRTMDPVGYKRINKRTGKEIQKESIVKGIKQEDGDYVVLSDEQIKAAYPKATQTIEIEAFVKAEEISFVLLERPYFLEPMGKSDKVYALLRESMSAADVIGIARIVMHTKEHLAALIPSGSALMLNTIRWESEMRSPDELKLPPAGKAVANLRAGDLKMAGQLIKDMTAPWKHKSYTDDFTDAVNKLIKMKIKAGDTETVTPLEDAPSWEGESNVVDLTELLAKSLGKRKPSSSVRSEKPKRTAAKGKPTTQVARRGRS